MANENKKTFLDFLKILTKWRRSLLLNFILVGIISIVISLLLPKWYKASSLVMAPQTGASSMGGLSALMSNLPLGGLGLSAGSGNEMVYVGILKSRTMADSVIDKYNLQEYYKNTTREQTYLSFYSDYEVLLTEENMISISFEYQDSLKVAEIVNFITTELKRKAEALFEQRASKNKKFIEDRYFSNLRKIDSLQIEMEMLQNKYGVFELIEQTKSILASIADLEAQIIVKRAELEALKQTMGESTPQYKTAKIQLESLVKEVDKIKYSNEENLENPFGSVFLPLDKFPEVSKKYTDIYTNLLLQQKLQEFLLPEYENAKMQLQKDKPVIQIIDYASAPDYKSRPKRAFIVLGALLVAFLLQFIYILIVERILWWQENEPEKYKDIVAIKKSWFRFFGKN